MSSGRPLRPAPPVVTYQPDTPVIVVDTPDDPHPKRKRHRHTQQEWEQQRDLFTILYHNNGGNLEDAVQRIQQERGFDAR